MNRRLTFLLRSLSALLPLFSLSASTPYAHRESSAVLEVSKASPEHTTISLNSPDISVSSRSVGYEKYQVFSLSGEPSIPEEGGPTLPQVTRFYRIPNTGGVDLVIEDAQYEAMDNINPLPYHEDDPTAVSRDPDIYSRDAWYPSDVAHISEPMQMRDFRVVMVTLYPVQVNPVTHQARVYRRLGVSINANRQPGANEITRTRRPSGAWSSIYRSQIANLDESALDDVTTTPGSYLILTSNNAAMLPWADSLAEWKTRKGFAVIIDARSNWSAASARTAIQTRYATQDPPLEFVCLMGDPGWSNVGIPADGINFDHSYALGNNDDSIEDIGVGRLSGQSSAVMATIMAKLMQYERTPHMDSTNGGADTTWYHKAFLYANVDRGCAGNALLLQWGRDQFVHNTGIDSVTALTYNGSPNMQEIRDQFDNGIALFLWRGTWIGAMPSTISLNPSRRLPITFTLECASGQYVDAGINSVAEAMLCMGTPTVLKGGICGIGSSTTSTFNAPNLCFAGAFVYQLADMQSERLGTAVAAAKTDFYRVYGSQTDPVGGTFADNYQRYYNLLGEPAISVWTDVPQVMNAAHLTMLNVGTQSVDVTITRASDIAPVADALVCLWKKGPDSIWVRGLTDTDGHITLPVTVNSPGDMFVTVTKRNYKPYLYTISCVQAGVAPMFSSVTLDDDNIGGTQGNSNQLMNPGETIDLPVYIRNFGDTMTATEVSATLTSRNPHVTVVNATSTYTDIAPGDSALGTAAFRIDVDSTLANLSSVILTLTVSSTFGVDSTHFPLTCYAPEAEYTRRHLNGALNPGNTVDLTVVITNIGSVGMEGISGHLTSLSPHVQVTAADASFGDMASQTSDSNSTPFTLVADPLTFRGHQAPLRLILSTTSGFLDTVQFIVTVGIATAADPTGPDVFGYYAIDNSDIGYEMHPQFNYVDISTGDGVNLNLADPGDKTLVTPIYAVALPLPFPVKFYGRMYDMLTVCSNGWCAFGDQSYMDLFRNYPIPDEGAPDAMIAPYFDDLKTDGGGQGVWIRNDPEVGCYIIQWKGGAGFGFSTPLDFEVILYDSTAYPTVDGNNRILVQYNQVAMNLPHEHDAEAYGSTIGIQAPGGLVGLQYAYQAEYAVGAAEVIPGRAILFTTGVVSPSSERSTHALPLHFALYQNFPNPFNPTTEIRFDLPKAEHVRLDIYNSLGQQVALLLDAQRAPGRYAVSWNGVNVATGLYFCRLEAGGFVQTAKMLLMK